MIPERGACDPGLPFRGSHLVRSMHRDHGRRLRKGIGMDVGGSRGRREARTDFWNLVVLCGVGGAVFGAWVAVRHYLRSPVSMWILHFPYFVYYIISALFIND